MPKLNTRKTGQMRSIRAPRVQDVSECTQCQLEGIAVYLAAFVVRCLYFNFSNGERFLVKKKTQNKIKQKPTTNKITK